MGWPQWTIIGLMFLNLGIALALDGQSRGRISFGTSVMNAVIVCWLLWMGGFFSQ